MKPTLTPAYGRDYKSRAAIESDLAAGKDFVANLMGGSTYCGLAEIESEGWTSINVRYSNMRKIAVIDVKRVLKLRDAIDAIDAADAEPEPKPFTVGAALKFKRSREQGGSSDA